MGDLPPCQGFQTFVKNRGNWATICGSNSTCPAAREMFHLASKDKLNIRTCKSKRQRDIFYQLWWT